MQLMRLAPWVRGSRLLLAACLAGAPVLADVLPEDRADALYHRYEGGNITIQGPSVLVRKKLGDNVSLSASYYEDLISGASIDVQVSGASPIREKRQQFGGSIDIQNGKTIYTAGVISSDELDYKAKTAYYSVSQSMFGDLTTVTLGFRRGWDDVMRNIKDASGHLINDPTFNNNRGYDNADHRAYSLGISQVLSRNLLASINYEKLTDAGYLANPYRQIRYLDSTAGTGYTLAPQVYPRTRTSDAVSGQLKYYLPYRAALTGSYRYYNDTWDIVGHTAELSYVQPLPAHWVFDASARYYTQTHASFYSDLFPRANYQNFMARDRELASFGSVALGAGLSYELQVPGQTFLTKSSLNIHYDRLMIHYRDFSNALYAVGQEPLYNLDANVFQVFISLWF